MNNKQCVFFVGFIFLSVFAMQETKQKFPIARRKSIPIIFKNGEPVIKGYESAEEEQKKKEKRSLIINEVVLQEDVFGLQRQWCLQPKKKFVHHILIDHDEVEPGNKETSGVCGCEFW